MNEGINTQLKRLERLSQKHRLFRFIHRPLRYGIIHLVRILNTLRLLPYLKVKVKLFWKQDSFLVDLPAHTDIFLYGCKMSSSDILLQRYLNCFLPRDVVFYDVGASLGYYSLFVSAIIGDQGTIHAVEPSPKAHNILKHNTSKHTSITLHYLAVGDANRSCTLHEFPTRYNEYNTLTIDEFVKTASWFARNPPVERIVPLKTLDTLIAECKDFPSLIKIDTEGSEALLISGMIETIENHAPDLLFRYWPNSRNNVHQMAVFKRLVSYGYDFYSLANNQKMEGGLASDYAFEYVLLRKEVDKEDARKGTTVLRQA